MNEDLFDKMVKALDAIDAKGGKFYIKVGPLAQAHWKWLIANGHIEPQDITIEAMMAADKKLGITPHEWGAFS